MSYDDGESIPNEVPEEVQPEDPVGPAGAKSSKSDSSKSKNIFIGVAVAVAALVIYSLVF